ncbi:redoxin domain-containing protein [Bremerella alba]|uniref:Thiol-disulfide oxidoreductase ResA n=1 Tax=Bremerella alba TaxID=980252 RepID=A0A7V9A969_9BACT|nr:redoxin domain-containing protein [Bremerella alba]MBA2117157.1 Thiol-disulfide oxidoreductase ResA [Bremerella alba]
MKFLSGFLSVSFLLVAASGWLFAEEAAPASDAATLVNLTRQDHRGDVHQIATNSRKAVRVFVFMTGECPVSRTYFPVLNDLYREWGKNEIEIQLLGIWADVTQTPQDVAGMVKEFSLEFPVLMDRDASLGNALQPTTVPEVFVFNQHGEIAYRGRIDDRFLQLGSRKPVATEETLKQAVEKVAAGLPVVESVTKPVGCYYELPPMPSLEEATLTFNRDIAPILNANCVVCHREGEVGPFTLTSYLDAAKRARQIARVVDSKLMPPWKAAQVHGEFEGQRTLSDREIETLKAWAKSERAEGDPADLPPLPTFAADWVLGEPDLVLEMQEDFDVPAGGVDIFRNFVIPYDIPEDKLVATIEFKPGDASVVHHSILYLDDSGKSRSKDKASPGPGYSTFGGPGFVPSGSIGGWSPGKTPRPLPDGLGRKMPRGADLVMQIHYHPNGKATKDRSKVGIYFVDKPKNEAFAVWTSSFDLDIPPGEKNYQATASYKLPAEVTLLSCIPHMHLLGQQMKATAYLPDGSSKVLIDVPQWDFNWQDEYMLADPLQLPAGTKIEVVAIYDNSADNPTNPSSPPQRVTFGEETTDEMLYCFFLVAAKEKSAINVVEGDSFTQEVLRRAAHRLKMIGR